MKKYSTHLLRIALVVFALTVLFFLLYAFPQIIIRGLEEMAKGPLSSAPFVLAIIGILYLSAIPFFLSLFQAHKLLQYLNRKQIFSLQSMQALKKMKSYSLAMGVLYVISFPVAYIISKWDDAPGFVIVSFLFIGAALVSAVFANVLERVIEEGLSLKKEA